MDDEQLDALRGLLVRVGAREMSLDESIGGQSVEDFVQQFFKNNPEYSRGEKLTQEAFDTAKRIAIYRLRNIIKKAFGKRRNQLIELDQLAAVPAETNTPSSLVRQKEMIAVVGQALATLSPSTQRVVKEYFWAGSTYKQIGEMEAKSAPSIRKKIKRACVKLLHHLKGFTDHAKERP